MKKTLALAVFAIAAFGSQRLPIIQYDPFFNAQKIIKQQSMIIKSITKTKAAIKLHLTAILNDQAYINGRFYKVGDKIGAFKVVKISSNSVHLKSKTKTTVLRFSKHKPYIQTKKIGKIQ